MYRRREKWPKTGKQETRTRGNRPLLGFDLEKEHTRVQNEEIVQWRKEREKCGGEGKKKSKRRKEKWREPNAAPVRQTRCRRVERVAYEGFRRSVLPPFERGGDAREFTRISVLVYLPTKTISIFVCVRVGRRTHTTVQCKILNTKRAETHPPGPNYT